MKYRSTVKVLLVVWGLMVFYLATAVFDGMARRSGFYTEGIQESKELADGN